MGGIRYSIVYHDNKHRIGYSPVKDQIFEYWLGSDGLIYVWCPKITDAVLAYEQDSMDKESFIEVCEL